MAIRDALNRFISPQQRDIERIRADLAEAVARLPELERQLTDAVAACAPSGDFSQARDIGQQVQMARERIAELQAALAAAETAEERRCREVAEREMRSRVRYARARLGEMNNAVGEIDRKMADIGRYFHKASEAIDAIRELLPAGDDAPHWPMAWWKLLPSAVIDAAGNAIDTQPCQTVTEAIEPLRAFLKEQIAALASGLPAQPSPETDDTRQGVEAE